MTRAAAAMLMLFLAACTGDSRKGGPVPYDTAAVMPLDTSIGVNDTTRQSVPAESSGTAPAPTTPVAPTIVARSDSAAGDMLYHGKARCFTCHGDRGTGTDRLGPSLADTVWVDLDGSVTAIRDAIANGISTPRTFSVAMPAYSTALTPTEMQQIAEYVFVLSHPGWTESDSAHATDSARTGVPPERVQPNLP